MIFIYKLDANEKAINLVKEFNNNFNKQPFMDGYARFQIKDNKLIVIQQMINNTGFSVPRWFFNMILKHKLKKVDYNGTYELLNKKDTVRQIGVLIWGK